MHDSISHIIMTTELSEPSRICRVLLIMALLNLQRTSGTFHRCVMVGSCERGNRKKSDSKARRGQVFGGGLGLGLGCGREGDSEELLALLDYNQ